MFKDKGILFGTLATIILIAGGIFLMTKGSSAPTVTNSKKVSQDILIPKNEYVTSGIQNGNYLPATESAKVILVEFGDYQCPACGEYHPLIKQLLTEFAGRINFVFRNFPLSQHKNSQGSAMAAEAVGINGKFWQMHDKLYETQAEWSVLPDPKDVFASYAASLGVESNKFISDFNSQVIKDKIKADLNDANLININATPTFYINGTKLETLPNSYDELKKLVSDQL
ncbi:MAG TPA: thioredoxin domain-containing protein [Patescibacteria group bacterium]|nr:thioredoxin domain-containing protein [Patescibacteria group bacterium]